MRFVEVKTEEQQAIAMVSRERDLLIGQRTQAINALRGHLAEYGIIAGNPKTNLSVSSVLQQSQTSVSDCLLGPYSIPVGSSL